RDPTDMIEGDPFDGIEAALRTGLDLSDAQVLTLGGLEGETLDRFSGIWREMGPEQRLGLLDRLGEAAEENLVLDFLPVYRLGVDDPSGDVRELALRLAAEDPQPEMLDHYLRVAIAETDDQVRVAAIDGLGN